MDNRSYIAALAPVPRLIETHPPPIGKKIWIITLWGNGYAGTYDRHDDSQFAWCELPALPPELKRLLLARQAARMMRSESND